jgi:hypothetical protein
MHACLDLFLQASTDTQNKNTKTDTQLYGMFSPPPALLSLSLSIYLSISLTLPAIPHLQIPTLDGHVYKYGMYPPPPPLSEYTCQST